MSHVHAKPDQELLVPINPSIPARQPQPLRRLQRDRRSPIPQRKAKLDRCWARNQGRTARRGTRCSVAQEHLVSQSEHQKRCEKSSVQKSRCPTQTVEEQHFIHLYLRTVEPAVFRRSVDAQTILHQPGTWHEQDRNEVNVRCHQKGHVEHCQVAVLERVRG